MKNHDKSVILALAFATFVVIAAFLIRMKSDEVAIDAPEADVAEENQEAEQATQEESEDEAESVSTEQTESYSFFVAGHVYGDVASDNEGVHPPFKQKFNLISENDDIAFGLFGGDSVLEGTVKDWDEIDADVAALGKDVHFVTGNHDVIHRDIFEQRYGSTYKSFKHKKDLFIMLDPNLDNWNISGDQLVFLKSQLSRAQNVDNIFVFFHQVLWWTPDNKYKNLHINSEAGRDETINFWTEIEPLFTALPNKVYMFSGDVGAFDNGSEYMYDSYKNISLIATGMGGGARDNYILAKRNDDDTVDLQIVFLNEDRVEDLKTIEQLWDKK